jgi:endonuclease/exonuclease/phosphatase family metal-dependent hydrolase
LIDKIVQLGRRWRRAVSRTRWTARFLHRPQGKPSDTPGLILLQIDGLSRTQFEAALARGRLPNLRRLIRSGHYAPMSFYSGLPSTTPAVQGEVMFGVRCAVPAFQYLDRQRNTLVRMFDSPTAHAVSQKLAAQGGPPLLAGGCSYSNIYAGGAAEARFCAETLDNEPRRLLRNPVQLIAMIVLYFVKIVRVIGLALLEGVIAVGDMIRGIAGREDWRSELKFISSRVAVSIVLREYLRVSVKLAIDEGAPIIYANFLGYDEQAHRRGPDSWFAHWVLKGIDGVVGDVWRSARRSENREYEVIVFSDHGQERTLMYDRVCGRSIQQAVEQAFSAGPLAGKPVRPISHVRSRGAELHERSKGLLSRRRRRKKPVQRTEKTGGDLRGADEIVVAALGPLGHVYVPEKLSDEDRRGYAERLVTDDRVPLVLYCDDAGAVWGHNRRGRWRVSDDAPQVLGPDHPFLQETPGDLVDLCRHENSGDLVICGWDPAQEPVTFVGENGAHGGVGDDEVRGFALVPDGVEIAPRRTAAGETYIRGEDLYCAGRRFVHGDAGVTRHPRTEHVAVGGGGAERDTFRVMTYNIHSSIGLDGRVRPERILQVIRSAGADVIALQEVDSGRQRSRRDDQARFLADRLDMSHHYFAVLEDRGERYGLAVISRFPMHVVKTAHLTPADSRRRCEARGAMWVELDTPWGPVQLVNTHFGLTRQERLLQAAALAGEKWLGRMKSDQPVVLCGDLNAGPNSPPCRLLGEKLRDALRLNGGARPRATFPSLLSLRRIDHIFVSRHFDVEAVLQTRTPTAQIASDHLPVCIDVSLRPHAAKGISNTGTALPHPSLEVS